MHLIVGNTIRVVGASRQKQQKLMHLLSVPNSKYINALKYSGLEPWQVRNIEKSVDMYTIKNGDIEIPRGYALDADLVGPKFVRAFNRAKQIDRRVSAPVTEPYPLLLIQPKAHQTPVIDKFKVDIAAKNPERPFGTYLNVMEVSAGKTITTALMSMATGQRTIVMVHTTLIMNAWIRDLCKMFGEDYKKEIGIIQGPKATVGPHFTIAMSQTWFRRQDMWSEWSKYFGCFIFDECAPAGTKISTPSGDKNIEDIRIGDLVYSQDKNKNMVVRPVTKLYNNNHPTKQLVKITLDDGSTLTLTENHNVYTTHGKKPIGEIECGDALQKVPQTFASRGYPRSVLGVPQWCSSRNIEDVPYLQKTNKISITAQTFSTRSKKHMPFGNGKGQHRQTASSKHFERNVARQVPTQKTSINSGKEKDKEQQKNVVKDYTNEGCKIFAPIRDASLFATRKTVCQNFSFCKKTGLFVPERLALAAGLPSREYSSGSGREQSQKNEATEGRSDQSALVLETENPSSSFNQLRSHTVVVKVERLSIIVPVYNFTVAETHNYFANGTLVANCHICPAKTFNLCAHSSPAKYRIGITGTEKRKDQMHKLMYLVFGTPFHRMKTKGLETETSMPVKDVIPVYTKVKLPDLVEKQIVTGIKWKNGKRIKITETAQLPPDGERDYMLVMDHVTQDVLRTRKIARKVVKLLKQDSANSILVATHRTEHARALRKAIKQRWQRPVALLIGSSGQRSKARLNRAEQALIERKTRVAVATVQFIKTGASIAPLNILVITTPVGGVQDLEQLIGRIRRKEPLKKTVKVYHVVDREIPMCKRHFQKRAVPFYRDVLKVKRYEWSFTA